MSENLNGGNGNGFSAESLVLDNFANDADLDNLGMDSPDAGDDFDLDNEQPFEQAPQQQPQPEIQQPQRQQPQQQPQRQQPQPQQRGIPQSAEVRPDQRGNLIGPDGRVVAKAGMEARLYQDTVRTRQALAQEQTRTQDVSNRLARAVEIGQQFHDQIQQLQGQLRERAAVAQRFGLNNNEEIQAMQLAADAKRDPAGTIKKILTMAAAAGVNLQQIGIAPGGVDPKSLVDMIRGEITQAMNPLQQRTAQENQERQQQQQQQEQYRRTESEVHGFFNENPGARPYIPVFHAVLAEPRFQHMTLGEVWAKIQLNQYRMSANGNGIVRTSTSAQWNPHASTSAQQRRNLPSGRGQPQFSQPSDMAPVSQSYDSILRETLDQLGVV